MRYKVLAGIYTDTMEQTEYFFRRISNWIHLRYKHITKRHSLYDYADCDGDLIYFRYNGRDYAMGEFISLGGMIDPMRKGYVYGGEIHPLHAVTLSSLPLYLELSENAEYVRLYETCNCYGR